MEDSIPLSPDSRRREEEAHDMIAKSLGTDSQALLLSRWLEEGVFEALELGYLRSLVISILAGPPPGKLHESYVFKISYPREGHAEVFLEKDGKSSITQKTAAKEAVDMMRSLMSLLQSLQQLPADRIVSLKLFYYDQITPSDWQPRFFRVRLGTFRLSR